MDNGLRNAMFDDYRTFNLRTDTGAIVEGSCYLELIKNKLSFEKLNFWRTTDGKEIDFILTLEDKSLIPIEVKFKSFPKPDIPAALKYFIKQYQPSHAIVLTKDSLHQVKLNSTQLLFVPLWMI